METKDMTYEQEKKCYNAAQDEVISEMKKLALDVLMDTLKESHAPDTCVLIKARYEMRLNRAINTFYIQKTAEESI